MTTLHLFMIVILNLKLIKFSQKYLSLSIKGLIHLKTLRGYALQDILNEVGRFVQLSKGFIMIKL
jgi:hypothetical protein